MTSRAASIYSDAVRYNTDAARTAANNKRMLALLRPKLTPLLRRLEGFDPTSMYISASASSYCNYGTATIYVDIRNLDGFKDERFAGLLESLMDAGYADAKTTDYAENFCRIYRLRPVKEDAFSIRIEITATVKSDSETCHRVAVGTEMREVVKYELRCEE